MEQLNLNLSAKADLKEIGNRSLSIINKCQHSGKKNDVWEAAVEINHLAKKLYDSIGGRNK